MVRGIYEAHIYYIFVVNEKQNKHMVKYVF